MCHGQPASQSLHTQDRQHVHPPTHIRQLVATHLVRAGPAREQLAGAHPGVLGIAPHQLLDAAPAHSLDKAALHLWGRGGSEQETDRSVPPHTLSACDHCKKASPLMDPQGRAAVEAGGLKEWGAWRRAVLNCCSSRSEGHPLPKATCLANVDGWVEALPHVHANVGAQHLQHRGSTGTLPASRCFATGVPRLGPHPCNCRLCSTGTSSTR